MKKHRSTCTHWYSAFYCLKWETLCHCGWWEGSGSAAKSISKMTEGHKVEVKVRRTLFQKSTSQNPWMWACFFQVWPQTEWQITKGHSANVTVPLTPPPTPPPPQHTTTNLCSHTHSLISSHDSVPHCHNSATSSTVTMNVHHVISTETRQRETEGGRRVQRGTPSGCFYSLMVGWEEHERAW